MYQLQHVLEEFWSVSLFVQIEFFRILCCIIEFKELSPEIVRAELWRLPFIIRYLRHLRFPKRWILGGCRFREGYALRQSLVLVDCVIIERSYLIDDVEFIRLSCIKIHLLSTFSSCLASCGIRFLQQHELLNSFFDGPTMPHRLYYRIHKAIKLIGLIAQQKVKLVISFLRASLGRVIATLIVWRCLMHLSLPLLCRSIRRIISSYSSSFAAVWLHLKINIIYTKKQ